MSHRKATTKPMPKNRTPAERFARRMKSREQFEQALSMVPDERVREMVRREVEPHLAFAD